MPSANSSAADRRRVGPDQIKPRKDGEQADLLIEALAADRAEELRKAYSDAMERGLRRRPHLGATSQRMPATAAKLAAL